MSENYYVTQKSIIDVTTGEILKTEKSVRWSGWKGDAYKYRYRFTPLTVFQDMDWTDLSHTQFRLFFRICRLMNLDNLLVGYERKSKRYTCGKYTPFTKDDIFELCCLDISRSTFERAWQGLTDKYVRKIKVEDMNVWAVNPAFVVKNRYVPVFLYSAFKDYMNDFITPLAKKKYENIELANFE